jgi:two-component system, response regulator, stage 0 sporulation protein F
MAKLRVLVVDDQHEVRRVLTTGIRTLGENLEVIDVPSGEEAHLEAIRHPIDLLVVDMRLPGITGIELVNRIRRRKPDVHVILVTGLEESSIRRQMTEAEADAFFYKPIHMADFLNAVEHSLGLKDDSFASPLAASQELLVASPPPTVKWISDLRQALDALAVILFDIVGQVEARAGDLPDPAIEDEWLKVISNVLSANAKLSHLIKASRPSGFWYLDGMDYHLCVTHLGKSHAALVVAKRPLSGENFQMIQEYSRLLDMDVQALTIEPDEMASLPLEEAQEEEVKVEDIPLEDFPLEDLPELDALFSQAAPALSTDADSFWDDLSGKEAGLEGAFGPKTLTYEQAMKLGIGPGEEEAQKD